jgi:hypothetical protein
MIGKFCVTCVTNGGNQRFFGDGVTLTGDAKIGLVFSASPLIGGNQPKVTMVTMVTQKIPTQSGRLSQREEINA